MFKNSLRARFLLAEDLKFRRINDVGLVDIEGAKYEKVRNLAFTLYLTNPLAGGMIDLLTDFVVGANEFEIEVVSEDQALKNELMDYIDFVFTTNELWNFRELYKELLLSGELHLPTGGEIEDLKIGFIPSVAVYQMEVDEIDHRRIKNIKYRIGLKEFEYMPITIKLKRDWSYTYEGNLFYFRINNTSSMLRGYSELISVIDWLDATDQLLWNSLETSALKNMFFYTLKVTGGTQEEIAALQAQYSASPPKPGTIIVGNDKLEWEIVKNDLSIESITEVVRTYKNYILSSKRLPEMWFAEGGYTNLATAREMTTAALKMFQSKQNEFKEMLFKIADWICWNYLTKGGMEGRGFDYDLNIKVPALERPEARDLASTLAQVVNALAVSIDYGWVRKEDAVDVVVTVLNRMGFDIAKEEVKRAIEEKEEEGKEREAELIKKIREALDRG